MVQHHVKKLDLSVVVDTVYVCPLSKSLVTRWDGEIKVLALVA